MARRRKRLSKDLVEVTTDKATFDIPAPCSGVLMDIVKKEGETARTDEIIATIQQDRS